MTINKGYNKNCINDSIKYKFKKDRSQKTVLFKSIINANHRASQR